MEVKSPIFRRWKLFTLGCFCGVLVFLLFIDIIQQNTTLSTTKNTMVELAPPANWLDPTTSITTPTEPSNFTTPHPDASPLIINSSISDSSITDMDITIEKPVQETKKECDIFDGRWVYDAEKKPSYNSMTCPFLEVGVRCQQNGRSDFEYENWRWEARDCNIPSFDGREMLEKFRNKRMIIVGDSINRNMWESFACLIHSAIPSSRTEADVKSSYKALKAKDYNFTVEFYMSPFLTELDKKHKSGRKVLILDQISSSSKRWQGAHIMVFNSGHWWTHPDSIKGWDLFQYKGKLIEEMPRELAYKRGMRTWASWIKKNVDPVKTNVFFRSISPTHSNRKSNQWCYNATQPIADDSYVRSFPTSLTNVIESVIKGMIHLHVKYLNITKLSQYRVDGHPSIYTMNLKALNKDNLSSHSDCSHWCLPGLPDTWNRLLYASILFNTYSDDIPSS